jgi:hypothetical protein
MNYLGRPIWLFETNWAEAQSRAVDFDLRSLLVGFGAEYFTPTQLYTVNGWTFDLLLRTGVDIDAVDAFTAELLGRLQGFWLPIPFEAAEFIAGVSTTQFDVVDQDLATTWQNRPDKYLLLEYPNGTLRAAAIQAVAAVAGNERITLTAALPEIPPAGTVLKRLHYVRLSDDEEKGIFLAEQVQRREMSVVELPTEYAAAEMGTQPIYLYHFSAGAPVGRDWYYTSFAVPVASNGKLYQPWPMNHGQIRQTVDGNDNALSIDAQPDATHPFSLFFPMPPGKPMRVQIYVVQYSAPDAATLLYSGRVVKVADMGSKYTATCNTVFGYLTNKLPRCLVGPTCPYTLYEPHTCKARRADFETTVIVAVLGATNPQTVAVTLNLGDARFKAQDYCAAGIFETGYGTDYEIRSILNSLWNAGSGQLELILNYPLVKAEVGQACQITAGCDHTFDDCKNKFANEANLSIWEHVPDTNLSLNALDTTVAQGGKK